MLKAVTLYNELTLDPDWEILKPLIFGCTERQPSRIAYYLANYMEFKLLVTKVKKNLAEKQDLTL